MVSFKPLNPTQVGTAEKIIEVFLGGMGNNCAIYHSYIPVVMGGEGKETTVLHIMVLYQLLWEGEWKQL